jgi:hypothetical protein
LTTKPVATTAAFTSSQPAKPVAAKKEPVMSKTSAVGFYKKPTEDAYDWDE